VFIGTTNKETYLRDETGGRRFWPVKAGTIRLDILSKLRCQLFAEAVHLYRQGEKWWPDTDFEKQHIRPEQDARYQADIWEEAIAAYLEDRAKITVLQIAREALNIDIGRIGRRDENRIIVVLESLHWTRGERTASERPWFPPRPLP
jgi:predicted P-loop ATPase